MIRIGQLPGQTIKFKLYQPFCRKAGSKFNSVVEVCKTPETPSFWGNQ
jgi:hypothetical protein